MINAHAATKRFGKFTALNGINLAVNDGGIFGLVGSNGAGKSTLMRLMAGVYPADGGSVTMDGQPVYDNPAAKARVAFVADELFFLPQSNITRMAAFYAAGYPGFSAQRAFGLAKEFGLDIKAGFGSFSKGMRRQAAFILALCTGCDYLLLDETLDGLDPVMRQLVKRQVYEHVSDRGLTVIMSSHSLRELEDTCDQLALLHKGGIVFESDVNNIKTSLFKVQAAFPGGAGADAFDGAEVLSLKLRGSVALAIVRGDREEVMARLAARQPHFVEILPLSLEEVFIHEMEAIGYAFDGGDDGVKTGGDTDDDR